MLTISVYAQKQDTFPHKNSFHFCVTGPINHSYLLSFERAYKTKSSLVLAGGVYHKKITGLSSGTTNGFIAELHDRNYFYTKQSEDNEFKWERFYLGPCLFFQSLHVKSNNILSYSDYTFKTFGVALMIGYDLTFHWFSFEAYFGTGLKLCTDESNVLSSSWLDGNMWDPDYQGPIVKGGINIGISF